ncbi:hypothetical protein AUK22_00855 [bacterium CG2_30_54_10]|nr:MAG: hypothetical protein AUK22_00855 [bacterium CG2_30_54_10]
MNNADLTLLNMNLLYVRYLEAIDRELHVPLGCLYLTKAIEDAGFTVDFRDYQLNDFAEPFTVGNIVDFLHDPAKVIGFSVMANLLPFALKAMKAVKERYPDRFIVLGGVGAKAVEEKIMSRFPWVDCIAVGEGERTGPELIRTLKAGGDLREVPGLVVRDRSGGLTRTPERARIRDLDSIPFPAFHKIDLSRYQGYGLMSTRGCPYPCTFCSVAPIWNHDSTFRSVENIIAEMKILHEKAGVRMFLFQDEFFVCNKQKIMAFCQKLRQTGLSILWKAFGRVDLTDIEMMEAMADAGCVELRFGIESGSDRLLKEIKKGFSAEQAISRVTEAVKIFPRVDAFYMWGFPFETLEDFNQTVFQMVMLRMIGARILPSMLCLLPQTELFRENRDRYPLDFSATLFPEYMITGHEISHLSHFQISPEHRPIYDFIQTNPDIFPGFFHMDLKNNVLPKLKILKKFGFYPEDKVGEGTDSCGAHSPRITAAPGLATRVVEGTAG